MISGLNLTGESMTELTNEIDRRAGFAIPV